MAILMTFPDPLDSPTRASPVRLRYGLHQRDGRTVQGRPFRAGLAGVRGIEAYGAPTAIASATRSVPV